MNVVSYEEKFHPGLGWSVGGFYDPPRRKKMCQPISGGGGGSGKDLSRRIHKIGTVGVYQGGKKKTNPA